MAPSAKNDDDSERDDLTSVKRKSRSAASARPTAKKSAPKPAEVDDPGDSDDTADTADTGADGAAEAEEKTSTADRAGKTAAAVASPAKESVANESGSREFSLTVNAETLRKAAKAVAALAVAVLLVVACWGWYSARQQLKAFDEVKAAASKFIVTSIEYTSADKIDQAKEVQGPLVTGKMREELSQDRKESAAAVRQQGIKATAKVDTAAVERIDGDEATTLMIVTATGTSNLSPTPQKRTVALRLQLRREGGKWLVAESKGVGDFSATGVNPQPGAPAPGAPAPR